jgi:hypothetical protein
MNKFRQAVEGLVLAAQAWFCPDPGQKKGENKINKISRIDIGVRNQDR